MINVKKSNKKQLTVEQKTLAKNSLFSFLKTYSRFFLTIVTSIIMARIISQEEWGFLILSTSYISLVSIVLTFLPPSLVFTINYYVSKYSALKEFNKLRDFIKKTMLIRLLFVLATFIFGLLFFIGSANFIRLNLENYYHLLFILSPLIIINGLDNAIIGIIQAMNMFYVTFYLVVLNYSINTLGLILIALFINPITIESIAIVILLSNLIPFLINFIIIYIRVRFKINKSEEAPLTYKELFKNLYRYGTPISVKNSIDSFSTEFRVQIIGFVESANMVTGFNIAKNFASFGSAAFSTLGNPTVISFTDLYTKDKVDEIERVDRLLFQYMLFILLFIIGIMFFLPDFFLFLVYGENYVAFSIYLKLFLISIPFNIINIFFYSLILATNKVKVIIPLYLGITAIRLPLFFVSTLYYGIIGGLIAILISNLLNFIIYLILKFKIFKIKTNIIKTISQYLILFVSIAIAIVFDILFLNEINYQLLNILGLLFFKNLNILTIFLFIILYLSLNFIFKIITSNDIENVRVFFDKDTSINKLIRKGLTFLKRFTRK